MSQASFHRLVGTEICAVWRCYAEGNPGFGSCADTLTATHAKRYRRAFPLPRFEVHRPTEHDVMAIAARPTVTTLLRVYRIRLVRQELQSAPGPLLALLNSEYKQAD
eukprot:4576075-Pyramimonas_sp.AAC.1